MCSEKLSTNDRSVDFDHLSFEGGGVFIICETNRSVMSPAIIFCVKIKVMKRMDTISSVFTPMVHILYILSENVHYTYLWYYLQNAHTYFQVFIKNFEYPLTKV